MSWLGGKRIAHEVSSRVGIEAGTPVVVGFDAKLAARLAAAGASVTFVSDVARDVARATTTAMSLAELEAREEPFAAAVIVGASSRDDRDAVVAAFCRALEASGSDGGRDAPRAKVALVDRVQRKVATKAAMLGGLTRLEQASVGRVVITVGDRIAWRCQTSAES